MVHNLVSLISNAFQSPMIKPIETMPSDNPFATSEKSNFSFSGSAFSSNKNYGKNMPVPGGYFAGYYNNKPNIVGQRLYIEA